VVSIRLGADVVVAPMRVVLPSYPLLRTQIGHARPVLSGWIG
jgi:hypothetical protein